MLYGVWCEDTNDWLRELPSATCDGTVAILAFTSRDEARKRAAEHYGYDSYAQARSDAWVGVFPLIQK